MAQGTTIIDVALVALTVLTLAAIGAAWAWRWLRQRQSSALAMSGSSATLPLSPEQEQQIRERIAELEGSYGAPLAVSLPQAGASATPADDIPRVELHDLARALNVAIIGPKGSGKTTTMTALLALRPGYVEALDPHNEPHKWPCTVVGGGERFDLIHGHLLANYATMRQRYTLANTGERSQATYQTTPWRVTLAGDEWGGIVSEIPDQRGTKDRPPLLGAGSLLGKLIARGRKVGIGMLIAAHDDTAAQFGLDGEMGLVACFDWLVYLGGQATGNTALPASVRQAAQRMTRPAVALDTARHAWCLLNLDTIQRFHATTGTPAPAPADFADVLQKLDPQRNTLLGALLAGGAGAPTGDIDAAPVQGGAARTDAVQASAAVPVHQPSQPESAMPQRGAPQVPAPTAATIDSPMISPDELRKTADAVRLVIEGASQTTAICQAFSVTKGSNPRYLRARWLYQQATARVPAHDTALEGETVEEGEETTHQAVAA